MAKRKRRTARQRAATKRLIAMNRARKRGVVRSSKRRSSRRGGIVLRRVSIKRRLYRVKSGGGYPRTLRANPPLGGWLRLPSTQELLGVGVGALALPAVTKFVRNLPFMPEMTKVGWGGIATELVIGSIASVAARRFINNTTGDVVFLLTLGKAVQSTAKQVLGPENASNLLGLGEDPANLAYYDPQNPALSYVDPSQTGGLNDEGDGMGADVETMV